LAYDKSKYRKTETPPVVLGEWRDQLKYFTPDRYFTKFHEADSFEHVESAETRIRRDNHILFVLDWLPGEDMKSCRLLSGQTGDLLATLIKVAKDLYADKKASFSWTAVSYSVYKTVGKSKDLVASINEKHTERLNDIICSVKPTTVVSFGRAPTKALISNKLDLSGSMHNWLGVPVDRKIRSGTDRHQTQVVASLSLDHIVKGDATEAYMLGYVARNVANALSGRHLFCIDTDVVEAHESVLIDDIGKFKQLMRVIREAPVVAIDTETANLNRVANKLLTIQFAKCEKFGYLLPVYHKDTSFSAPELKYIKRELRNYFEGDNSNKYHVYANAKFDLTVLRQALGCRFMANDVWDIFAGEFAIDENFKSLEAFSGGYYYSLKNLSIQYGFEGYLTSSFGKEDRATIETHDLDEGLVRYSTLDVIVPFLIHKQQRLRAKFSGHTGYNTIVSQQLSDTIHSFSRMEHNGSLVDIDYLFYLKTPGSPIEKVIQGMTDDLNATDAVKKANRILSKELGIPVKGLFGESNSIFNLRKDRHKQCLFFEALELEPIEFGAKDRKTGEAHGKLDAKFQKAYKDVPEVAMFTAINKAKKLKNAYVNSFIKLLSTGADFRLDHRIRPNYSFLPVVTYRTSASDPNLQQIPSRSELGKHIKRLFVAKPGSLYIKVDYRVHEVRGWGIVSFDKAIAKLFSDARKIRDAYRANPSPELKNKMDFEADIHILNVLYFFRKTIAELMADKDMKKSLRDAVKGVTFGLIYQMSVKTLAEVLKQTLEFTKELVAGFTGKFPQGMKWIDNVKVFARKHFYVESPIKTRRNLWGYLMPALARNGSRIWSEMDRRAVNSPIQGMAAQMASIGMRMVDKLCHKIRVEEQREIGIEINNSVHDSVENTATYENYLESLGLIEDALTTQVKEVIKKRYDFELVSDLEIDFECGPTLSETKTWDFSLVSLEDIVHRSVCFQKFDLHYDIDVAKVMETVFVDGWERAPAWLKLQAKNIGWKFNKRQYRSTDYSTNPFLSSSEKK